MYSLASPIGNWRVYPLTVADQQQHIHQSEQLLSTIQPGDQPILYWSLAASPGLVLGFSQKPTAINQMALVEHPLPIYHRRAGGTAVLVGPDLLSLDVILPAQHPLVLNDVVESYRWFGEIWVATLAKLGILTRIVPPSEARAQQALRKQPETREQELLLHRACYGTLSPYEVVEGRRKVVGLDMIRRKVGSLLQAGVLLHWDPTLLAQLLGHTQEEQQDLAAGLCERAVGLDILAGRFVGIEAIIPAFESVIATFDSSRLTNREADL